MYGLFTLCCKQICSKKKIFYSLCFAPPTRNNLRTQRNNKRPSKSSARKKFFILMSVTTTTPLLPTTPPLSTTPTQLRKVIFALQQELAEQLNDSKANKSGDKADDGGNNNNNNDDGLHPVADLSDARLEQFRSDLERVGSDDSSPCVITAADYQAIIPALACGTSPPLPRLPQRARCVLLRRLRSLVEDHHLDGNRTTPGAFFDFPEARTGVIQLASIPGRVWSSFQSFTFVMWIWFPRKISTDPEHRNRVGSGLETTQPQDALLFSLSTPTAIGIEGRMKEAPSAASRSITLELRSIDPISTRTSELKTCVSSTSVQSNRWHLLSLTQTSLSTGNEARLNSTWYLDGKRLRTTSNSVDVPYPKVSPSDSMSNCMVGGRFSGRLGGFGLFGGEMSTRQVRALHSRGPGHAMPPISVFGPLPKFSTIPQGRQEEWSSRRNSGRHSGSGSSSSSSGGTTSVGPENFHLPVIFWYDARHLTDKRIGYENTKVDEWCARGTVEGDVVAMTPILEMRHTTPIQVRRRSMSHSLLGGGIQKRGRASQDDRTARLAGGVKAIQSRSGHAQRSLYVVGGTSVLLPLFAQLEPPPPSSSSRRRQAASLGEASESESKKEEKEEGNSDEMFEKHDEALELMMFVLQLLVGESGTLLMEEMHHLLATVPTISVLLHGCDPAVLSAGFLGSVMLFVRDVLPIKPELAHQIIRDILLDFSLWSKARFDVQRQLVHLLYGLDSEFPSLLSDSCGVQRLLDMTQIAYCRVASECHPNVQRHAKEASECAVQAVELTRKMFHVDREGREDERMMARSVAESQGKEMYGSGDDHNMSGDPAIFLSELNALLCFVRCCSGSPPGKAAAAAALKMIHELMDDPHSRRSTYTCLQTLGGAAEIVPLVSRPGASARIAAIGLLGRVLAESRRIVLNFQHTRASSGGGGGGSSSSSGGSSSGGGRSGGGGGGGRGSVAGGVTGGVRGSRYSSTGNLDTFSGSPRGSPRGSTGGSVASSAALALQAAASLYGGENDIAASMDVTKLPSEAKPALMVRLMSATLIELTSKETLAMVSCADDCWSESRRVSKKNSMESVVENVVEVEEVSEGWTSLSTASEKKKPEETEETEERDGESPSGSASSTTSTTSFPNSSSSSNSSASTFRWPSPAKSRHVSEETVDAVIELITGSHRANDPLTGGGDCILLPEGLLLLFGLLSTKSVRPAVRCRCMTLVGVWIKASSDNAMAILRVGRWQRWLVGLHSASLRLYHSTSRGTAGGPSVDKEVMMAATGEKDAVDDPAGRVLASKSSRENTAGTNEKNEEIDNTKSNVLVRTEGEENNEETCGPIMTSLVVDALACLYRTLLFDVKKGYEHWSVLQQLTTDIPCGLYFCRAVVVATLRRCHQSIQQQTPLTSGSLARRASLRASLTMPSHVADNLAATFQFVEERLLDLTSSHNSNGNESFVSINSSVVSSVSLSTHVLADTLDDDLCQQKIQASVMTSALECSGSDLLTSILPLVLHMRRCGAMKMDGSTYPPLTNSDSKIKNIKSSTFSKCLSWRIAPVVRTVLAVQESDGR